MEIKLNLLEDYDAYKLFILLGNKKSALEQENCKHHDMIKLLVGNENNELAISRLESERNHIKRNNEDIQIIDNIRNQLKPLVEEVIGLKK